MTTVDGIAELMVALGPLDAEIDTITRDGETEWSVAFDEETVVSLSFVEEQQKLVLASTLATPPTEQRLAAYETLLCYNLLWAETGGVRMALGGAHGAVVQLFDLATAGLDVARLDAVLVNFAVKAKSWRGAILSGAFATAPGLAEQRAEFMIRV